MLHSEVKEILAVWSDIQLVKNICWVATPRHLNSVIFGVHCMRVGNRMFYPLITLINTSDHIV